MSIKITIDGISKNHVCKQCGSGDWHVNLIVKANEWHYDQDWEMYCPECESQTTTEDLVHIYEYKKYTGYYIVWVAPNPKFPEEDIHINEGELLNFQEAQKIADKLNHETKGSVGKYEVRKYWYSEEEVA